MWQFGRGYWCATTDWWIPSDKNSLCVSVIEPNCLVWKQKPYLTCLHFVSSPAKLATLPPCSPAAHGLEAQELMAKAGGAGAALELHWLSLSSRKGQGLHVTSNTSCGDSIVRTVCLPGAWKHPPGAEGSSFRYSTSTEQVSTALDLTLTKKHLLSDQLMKTWAGLSHPSGSWEFTLQ